MDNEAEVAEPASVELPVGRSADPALDEHLSRARQPSTSGASLVSESADLLPPEAELDTAWNDGAGLIEGEQTESYDSVSPEALGSVWLERATQTTHDHPHGRDPFEVAALDDLVVSQASKSSASPLEDDEEGEDEEGEDEDLK